MLKKINKNDFPGEWILLFNDKIVDHSANIEDIIKLVDDKFPESKFPNDTIVISKNFQGNPRNSLSEKQVY